jgi:hypothetical protein
MLEERDYENAMKAFFRAQPTKLRQPGTRYPKRSTLHDR